MITNWNQNMECKLALSAKEVSQTVNKKLAGPPKP